MKITGIIILFDCSNPQLNYRAGVLQAKQELRNYFGTRSVIESDEDMPVFAVNCEVNDEDLSKLENKFTSVRFIALQGDPDKIKGMSERIISLK